MKKLQAILLALLLVGVLSVSLIGCNSEVSPAEDVYISPTEEVYNDNEQ